MTNRFLQLPFVFDPDQLRQELPYCRSRFWTNHFNAADYAGSWRTGQRLSNYESVAA